jgi:two-component system nitrate/nitrite response regulator NarL
MIANQLNITEATVKVHLKSLLRKINASNRTQAAIWALNNGIGGDQMAAPAAAAAATG